MIRSTWKGPFSHNSLHKIITGEKKLVWARNSMVLPLHIGKEFLIYNGKSWILLKVIEEMVGHKFGEFCSTRKKTIHKFQKKKQSNRKKH